VRLIEASAEPFAHAASRYGGVMLAPEREAETAPPLLRALGCEGIALWRALYPGVVTAGSLVVAAARDELADLRGVRGERLVVRTREIALGRPVQLLHPRHPLYVVPWGDGRYVIGATVIETEDDGPVTVRSALELLGAAYALHPAFGEAQILDLGAGVRPAFPDNMPRVVIRENGRRIFVNGAYRHGFLLAPVLAGSVAAYLETGTVAELMRVEV
jgi:glycine/D-amino acid oxidase-like deaminating enzyme